MNAAGFLGDQIKYDNQLIEQSDVWGQGFPHVQDDHSHLMRTFAVNVHSHCFLGPCSV